MSGQTASAFWVELLGSLEKLHLSQVLPEAAEQRLVTHSGQTHFSAMKTLGQTSSTSFQGASWRSWTKARCRSRTQGVLYRLVSSIFSRTRLYKSSTNSCSADSSRPGQSVSARTPRGLSSGRNRQQSHQRVRNITASLLLERAHSWPVCCQGLWTRVEIPGTTYGAVEGLALARALAVTTSGRIGTRGLPGGIQPRNMKNRRGWVFSLDGPCTGVGEGNPPPLFSP